MSGKSITRRNASKAYQTLGRGRRSKVTSRGRRQLLIRFLRKHPEAVARDLKGPTKTALVLEYRNRIVEARRDAGIPPKGTKDILQRQEKRKRLVEWVRKNPDLGIRELRASLPYGSSPRITILRKEIGIIPDGYVLAAEKARQMGVSREWVRYLVNKGRLKYLRISRYVFIHKDELPTKLTGSPGRPRKTSRASRPKQT